MTCVSHQRMWFPHYYGNTSIHHFAWHYSRTHIVSIGRKSQRKSLFPKNFNRILFRFSFFFRFISFAKTFNALNAEWHSVNSHPIESCQMQRWKFVAHGMPMIGISSKKKDHKVKVKGNIFSFFAFIKFFETIFSLANENVSKKSFLLFPKNVIKWQKG